MKTIPLCLLVVGHSEHDGGALAADGRTNEYRFNEALARRVAGHVYDGLEVEVMHRTMPYGQLPAAINAKSPAFVVEMHFNAADGKATGTETLYWHQSKRGKVLAGLVQARLVQALGLPDRGCKPVDASGRGAAVLRGTAMPCVIAEPFFGDNPADWERANRRINELARGYALALQDAAWVFSKKQP